MENTDMPQDTVIDNLTEIDLYELNVPTEILKSALEAIIKEKPELKNFNLMQLKANDEFQQMFQKYITETYPSSIKAESLKKIKSNVEW